MQKVFAVLFFFLLLLNALILILIINLKISLLSPQKIKNIAQSSNAYEFAAASIRESFSKEVDMKAGDGIFVEILSESITADVIQQISEQAIDQFFQIVRNPQSDSSILISFASIDDSITEKFYSKTGLSLEEVGYAGVFGEEQRFVLGDSVVILLLSNINLLIAIISLIVIALLIILFVLSGKTASRRFSWIGANLFVTGLILLGATLFVYTLLPDLLSKQLEVLGIADQKLLIGIGKIIRIIFAEIKILLVIETMSALLIGFLLFRFGRGIKETKIDVLAS